MWKRLYVGSYDWLEHSSALFRHVMRAGVANLTVNDNYFAVVTKVKARVLAGDESHRQRDMCRSEQRITHGTAGRIGFEDVVQQVNRLVAASISAIMD